MGSKQDSETLPIQEVQENLLSQLRDPDTHVMIISGTTGCGKTTKIPQIIYHDYSKRNEKVNIICTQPRRVACMNIARKVAFDMGTKVGNYVGQSIQNESVMSAETRIRFVTTGILLNQVVSGKDLSEYTHIIVDEVHERDLDTDFLLCLLRQLIYELNTRHDTSTKLIIMSATVDENIFADQFAKSTLRKIQESRKIKKEPHVLQQETVKLLKTSPVEKPEMSNRIPKTQEELERENYSIEQFRNQQISQCKTGAVRNAIRTNDLNCLPDLQKDNDDWVSKEADHNFNNSDQNKFACPIISLKKRLFEVKVQQINEVYKLLQDYLSDKQIRDDRQMLEPTKFLENLEMRADPQAKGGQYNISVGEPLLSIANMERRQGLYRSAIDNFEKDFTINYMADWMQEMGRDLVFLIELMGIKGVTVFDEGQKDNRFYKKSVLVFLPGLQEINTFTEQLKTLAKSDNPVEKQVFNNLDIYQLHSSLKIEANHEAFKKPREGKRKIILATNIAESSITIPDVSFVIDQGLYKELNYSSHNRMERLDLKYASRASLEQRKGRAGRVNKGYCFRIMTENYFQNSLNNFINPEIMRCPLEKVILKTKISGIGEPLEILNSCINNPNDYDMGNAFRNLIDFGAISIPNNLNPSGKVTFIGEMIAKLPCDIKITRILLMGYCFRVFEQASVICAFLNVEKDMFQMRHSFLNVLRDKLARHKLSMDDLNLSEVEDFSLFDMRTWQNKVSFSDDSNSDHIAYLNCFNKWLHEYRSELIDEMSKYKLTKVDKRFMDEHTNQKKEEVKWSLKNFVNLDCMQLTFEQITDLKRRLIDMNLKPEYMTSDFKGNKEDYEILKIAITSGLISQVAQSGYFWREDKRSLFLSRNDKQDMSNSIIINNAPTEILEKQENKTKVDYTLRKAGQIKDGLIDVNDSRIYIEYENKIGLMSALRRKEGDSYSVDIDVKGLSFAQKERINKEQMNYTKQFYIFDPDCPNNKDVNTARRLRVRFERAYQPYSLKFQYNNEEARVDTDSVCSNLIEPDTKKVSKYMLVSSNVDVVTKNNLLTLKCNSAFESKYDMLQDILTLLFQSQVSLVKFPGTDIQQGQQIINKADVKKFSHFLSVEDLEAINEIRKSISDSLSQYGLTEMSPQVTIRNQIMTLIQKKRIEVDDELWYLYRVYAYFTENGINVEQLVNTTDLGDGINISDQLLTNEFLKQKEGKPNTYNLDQLIEFFSKEHVNKDMIDYLPRITNIINTGHEIDIEKLNPLLLNIKEQILTERKKIVRTTKNLTSIVSDDFLQLPITCARCHNILFRLGNLKGITSSYERQGFFDLRLSDFCTFAVDHVQDKSKNQFYEIWDKNLYKDILGDGPQAELKKESKQLVCSSCKSPQGLQTNNEKLIIPPQMFNVLLADGSLVEFNKKCYKNYQAELIDKHQIAWNKSKDVRRVNECRLTKLKFNRAEDLVNQYEKDIKYKKFEHNQLNQAHYYLKEDK